MWAAAGYLVTFGIPPSRPETGYGYIKQGAPLDEAGTGFAVARFIEKPDLARAQAFLDEGGYYWNSGIFLFRRDVLLAAMARYLPEVHQGLVRLMEDANQDLLAEIYRDSSQHLPGPRHPGAGRQRGGGAGGDGLERRGHLGGLTRHFPQGWTGTTSSWAGPWTGTARVALIYAQNRLVATIGLENVIVVDTPDATLVCHRDRVQEVKDLVAELNRREMVESVQHPTVERPWGRYTVMDEGPGYKVKQIEVVPGSRLSLQMHQHRAEHWVVVQGTARVTIGPDIKLVTSNQSVYIPLKTAHRLENPETEPLAHHRGPDRRLPGGRRHPSAWTTTTGARKRSERRVWGRGQRA